MIENSHLINCYAAVQIILNVLRGQASHTQILSEVMSKKETIDAMVTVQAISPSMNVPRFRK